MKTKQDDSAPTKGWASAGRALHLVATVITLGAALLLGLALVPSLWGWSSMVVTSGSMEPTFGPGDVVLVQPLDASGLEPMDIITFTTPGGEQVTHRITDKATDLSGTTFITKGDANEDRDPEAARAENVVGQVRYSVPRIGYVVAWARTPVGLGLLALGLAYVAFGGRNRKTPSETDNGDGADPEAQATLVRT